MLNEIALRTLTSDYDNQDEILSELSKLSPNEEVEVLSQLIGYDQIPPTIEEFLYDPYYLGDIYGKSLFPIWEERLKLLYPDPIRTSGTFVSVGGAIGTGKSRFSTIATLYDYCKFSMISDPYRFLHLDPTTEFTMRFYNVDLPKASKTFISPIMTAFKLSPYFRELHKKLNGYAHRISFLPASLPRHALSECIVSSVISEVNFFKPGVAASIIDSVISRLESRMQCSIGFLPHVILDSSDTTEDSAVCDFIKSSAYSDELIHWTTKIWEAKSHLGIYFNSGSFRVYAGDSDTAPFIFRDEKPIDESKLDPERIVECPNEVKSSFETNIELALQEKCGISLRSSDRFILDKETVKSKFDLPMVTEPVIVSDFYDNEPLINLVPNIYSVLPEDRKLFIRVDMGVSHDRCGFAIAHFDGLIPNPFFKGEYLSSFKVPVAFGISRISGQETPINKIRDFVIEISKNREVHLLTTDQYQSTQLRQECIQHGVDSKLTSVDRTDDAYITFKNLTMQDRCHVCNNILARTEVLDLKRVGRKIDHTITGINSKDISDAIVGAVHSAYIDPKAAATPTAMHRAKVYSDVTSMLKVKSMDRRVGKLNNRNFW